MAFSALKQTSRGSSAQGVLVTAARHLGRSCVAWRKEGSLGAGVVRASWGQLDDCSRPVPVCEREGINTYPPTSAVVWWK